MVPFHSPAMIKTSADLLETRKNLKLLTVTFVPEIRTTFPLGKIHLKMSSAKCWLFSSGFNSSLPGQSGRHFADDIFKCIFVNEKFCISIKISLKFFPKGSIDNDPASV